MSSNLQIANPTSKSSNLYIICSFRHTDKRKEWHLNRSNDLMEQTPPCVCDALILDSHTLLTLLWHKTCLFQPYSSHEARGTSHDCHEVTRANASQISRYASLLYQMMITMHTILYSSDTDADIGICDNGNGKREKRKEALDTKL